MFGKGPVGWDRWDRWDGWDGWDSWDKQINRQLEGQSGKIFFFVLKIFCFVLLVSCPYQGLSILWIV